MKWPALALCLFASTLGQARASEGMAPEPARFSLAALQNFLELTPPQREAIARMKSEHVQGLAALAASLKAPAPSAHRSSSVPMLSPDVCERATIAEDRFRKSVRQLLQPAQVTRLAVLEQAMALLPQIEAAQAAGLLPQALLLPPPGLPSGSVEVPYSWKRTLVAPLPGCPGTKVHVEVGLETDARPRDGKR